MALKVISLLVILLICTSSISCSKAKMSISREEDLELERQLKILNKLPIKTIQTKEGDIIDCIDINKQPALDHPLLKNHKVQLRPSSFPAGLPKTSAGAKSVKLRSRREACPSGTVPIKRTRKEDLVRATSLSEEPSISFGQHISFSDQHTVDVRMKNFITYYGATAYVSIYNLSIAPDQSSSANVWIQGGPPDQINVIVSGWRVSQSLNGDNRTRLFTYWTGDGYHKTGCYNTLCPGFVQTDGEVTPNHPIGPASTYGGDQYDIKFLIYQDRQTGNWWLVVSDENIKIGYWPKEIFTHLRDGAENVAWGGTARAGKDGISPPMGNGHIPDGHYRNACFFRQVHFISENNGTVIPKDDGAGEHVDKSGCYGLKNDKYWNNPLMGYSFTFGGPGGHCGVNSFLGVPTS